MTAMTPQQPRATFGATGALPRSVRLTLFVWTALLALCPRGFRRAYADEMAQVFSALLLDAWRAEGVRGVTRQWAPAIGDLARGAMAAHADDIGLTIEAARRSWFMSRMRSSAIVMFCAYILLVLTGIGYQKLTEDIIKTSLPATYPGVALAQDAVIAGAVLGLLAVVVGGVPIAWASIRQALAARRYDVLALWVVPPVSLAVVIAWFLILVNVVFANRQTPVYSDVPGLWFARSLIIVFILAAIVSVAAVGAAVSRSDVPAQWYRFGLRSAIVATVGMFITVAGVAAFTWQVQMYAPADLAGLASPLLFGESTGLSLVIQVVVMLIAAVIAVYSVIRGLGSSSPMTPKSSAVAA